MGVARQALYRQPEKTNKPTQSGCCQSLQVEGYFEDSEHLWIDDLMYSEDDQASTQNITDQQILTTECYHQQVLTTEIEGGCSELRSEQ